MSEEPNTVDQLMDHLTKHNEILDQDPLLNTPKDIDWLIAYHRKARASATGGKARKDSGPKVDISEVMKALGGAPAPAVGIVRRR